MKATIISDESPLFHSHVYPMWVTRVEAVYSKKIEQFRLAIAEAIENLKPITSIQLDDEKSAKILEKYYFNKGYPVWVTPDNELCIEF